MSIWISAITCVENIFCIQDVFLEANVERQRDKTRKKGSTTNCGALLNQADSGSNATNLLQSLLPSEIRPSHSTVHTGAKNRDKSLLALPRLSPRQLHAEV